MWLFSLQTNQDLILPERCNSLAELNKVLTLASYDCINFTECNLDDDALSTLSRLSQLRELQIAATPITGRCLEKILNIPGLESLNIAFIESLDTELTTRILCDQLPVVSLNELNISANQFSCSQLERIINAVFSGKSHFELKLGDLALLSDAEVMRLYHHVCLNTINNATNVTISSRAFDGLGDYLTNRDERKSKLLQR